MSQSAKVVKKIVSCASIKTMAPLRISSGTDDGIIDSLILKDRHGQAFIPATSLGGVLRSELLDIYGEEAVNILFGFARGENDEQSMINISDIMLTDVALIYRDGVKIDEITGTGIKGAKFDYEAIDRGAHGVLQIELTIREADMQKKYMPQIDYLHKEYEDNADPYGEMMATIADLLTSGVYLGSLTTKGYGLVKSQESVTLYTFDFSKKGESDAWIKYLDWNQAKHTLKNSVKELRGQLHKTPSYEGCQEMMAIKIKQDLLIQLDFSIKSALIIRDFDGANYSENQEKLRVSAIQLKSKNDYVIPGTSLKGVLRHKAYDILMILTGRNEDKVSTFLDSLMGFSEENTNNSSKSRFEVGESYISAKKVKAIQHCRNRIDRFTGSTINNALFSDEPIWQSDKGEATVPVHIRIKNCTPQEAGLALLLVKDLWLGNLPIGGNKGIGRGVLQGRSCNIAYRGETYHIEEGQTFSITGKKDLLEEYVKELVGECNG